MNLCKGASLTLVNLDESSAGHLEILADSWAYRDQAHHIQEGLEPSVPPAGGGKHVQRGAAAPPKMQSPLSKFFSSLPLSGAKPARLWPWVLP